jgi:hypothetical protein
MNNQINVRINDEDLAKIQLLREVYGWPVSVVLRAALRLLYEHSGIEKTTNMSMNRE